MPLSAILWDLDGTIVDSERDNVQSVVLAVRRLGCDLDDEDRHFIVGHSWNEIHTRLAAKHRLNVGRDELISWAVDEKRTLLAGKGHTPLPGALAAVRRLSGRAPMAVVSGASRVEVSDAIDGLALRPAFRFLLGAEDYPRGKPDPEPYLTAARRLGVSPQGCLVLEDAEPGILSGRAAGARVIGIRVGNFSGYDLSAAHLVVDTLDEVTDATIDRLMA